MKKIIYTILLVCIFLFTGFGILGFFVMLSSDIFGSVFFAIWSALGVFLFRYIRNKKKNVNLQTIPQSTEPEKEAVSLPKDTVSVNSETSISETAQNKDTKVPVSSVESTNHTDAEIPLSSSKRTSNAPAETILPFPDAYLVLDVETPNQKNDRISQIGLLLINHGKVIKNYSTLINPETDFSPITKKLTGIDASMVIDAPKFNDYWSGIAKFFHDYTVVAHNAKFDLTVLCKTLSHYQIEIPDFKYVCTYVEAQNKMPELGKYSLSNLCAHFSVSLDNAHNANADAMACCNIFEKMKSLGYYFVPSTFTYTTKPETASNINAQPQKATCEIIDLPYSEEFDFDFEGRRFVLTGIFTEISQKQLSNYITEHGGTITQSVSGRTDYLIVGSAPEPTWKYGSYGSKIKKALEILDNSQSHLKLLQESLVVSGIDNF